MVVEQQERCRERRARVRWGWAGEAAQTHAFERGSQCTPVNDFLSDKPFATARVICYVGVASASGEVAEWSKAAVC
jgi:hypothetical protein